MIKQPKKWMVTEKGNIFLRLGILSFFMASAGLMKDPLYAVCLITMLIGIWILLFYEWQYIDEDIERIEISKPKGQWEK